jgi:hypothetical protein
MIGVYIVQSVMPVIPYGRRPGYSFEIKSVYTFQLPDMRLDHYVAAIEFAIAGLQQKIITNAISIFTTHSPELIASDIIETSLGLKENDDSNFLHLKSQVNCINMGVSRTTSPL